MGSGATLLVSETNVGSAGPVQRLNSHLRYRCPMFLDQRRHPDQRAPLCRNRLLAAELRQAWSTLCEV